jgi:hypothetical protein
VVVAVVDVDETATTIPQIPLPFKPREPEIVRELKKSDLPGPVTATHRTKKKIRRGTVDLVAEKNLTDANKRIENLEAKLKDCNDASRENYEQCIQALSNSHRDHVQAVQTANKLNQSLLKHQMDTHFQPPDTDAAGAHHKGM